MPGVAPTLESVFTPEYWQPIPERTDPVTLSDVLKSHRGTKASIGQAREHLLLASNRLIEGVEPQRINSGELLGGPDDSKYALPGAVILLDEERLWLRPHKLSGNSADGIKSEDELAQSAVTTFLTNRKFTSFKNDPNYAVYNSYQGNIVDPRGKYTRVVRLYAYYLSKKGMSATLGMMQYRHAPGNPDVIAPTGLLRLAPWRSASRVEETVNETQKTEMSEFYRVRSAYLCLQGIAETVKAKGIHQSRSVKLKPSST